MNKYLASIAISLRHQLAQRGRIVGRLLLYTTIIYLFYQVFQSVSAPQTRFWYLAITEWIILSTAPIALRIHDDISSGQFAYFMLRPIHYVFIKLCESVGTTIVQFIQLGILCITIGYLLTEAFPTTIYNWVLGVFFAVLGIFLYTLISILIGLLSYWITEIQNLIYLNLTATFCFGGLIIPLNFYSEWFQIFSFCTPYPWILWWPATFIMNGNVSLIYAFLGWILWIAIISFCIMTIYRKYLESLVVEGG